MAALTQPPSTLFRELGPVADQSSLWTERPGQPWTTDSYSVTVSVSDTPAGRNIGAPVAAIDADNDLLTYSLGPTRRSDTTTTVTINVTTTTTAHHH